ncbi:GumC family protein [Dongia deserti]|uniref:GumC family protein n=1 Tax=Dongia deserti TaxID=2268030 RepID=UPI000E65B68E|nr:polysaccharide biosynthesis tyrosine autokinase [Dongia deserti]
MKEDRTRDEGELRSVLHKVSRHRAMVVGCLLLGTGISWLVLDQAVPRYDAEAQVVLGIRSPRIVEFDSVLSNFSSQPGILRTEMDIIVSRRMAERVLSNMSPIDQKQLAAASAIVSPLERMTRAMSSLVRDLEPLAFGARDMPADAASTPEPGTHPPSSIPRVSDLVQIVSRGVSATNDGQSYTIHIGYSSSDAQLAAKMANLYAEAYIANQLESKAEAAERASAWLSERLVELRHDLETSATAVQTHRREADILQGKQGTVTAQQLAATNDQLVSARGERLEAESRLATLRSTVSSGGDIGAIPDVMSSPVIQSLRDKQADLKRKQAESESRYTNLYPADKTLQADLAAVQRQIDIEIALVAKGLVKQAETVRAKERALEDELGRLQRRFGEGSDAEVKLQLLQRESDANRAVYEAYLSRLKETTEQGKIQEPDSYIISSAVPPDWPSYPRRLPLLLLGTLFGGLAGITLALLRELFEQRLYSVDEVEQLTGLRVLALVPSLRWPQLFKPENYVLRRPGSLFNEALRTTRAAITLSQGNRSGKVILVTSSIPGEGKTAFCVSLARLLATDRHKVLLVDSDLRRPSIAKALGCTSASGLADFLAGAAYLQETVQIDYKSGAHYISSREESLNPQDLLNSGHMEMLIEEARSRYDLVIIDSPPILVAADAAIVARCADHCLFFVRWGSTARDYVANAVRKLELYKVTVTGIVLSHVNTRRHAQYALGEGYYGPRRRSIGLMQHLQMTPRGAFHKLTGPGNGK